MALKNKDACKNSKRNVGVTNHHTIINASIATNPADKEQLKIHARKRKYSQNVCDAGEFYAAEDDEINNVGDEEAADIDVDFAGGSAANDDDDAPNLPLLEGFPTLALPAS